MSLPVDTSSRAALRRCVGCRWPHSSFASGWWREATATAAFRTAWGSCTPGSPSASTRLSQRRRTTPTWSCRQLVSPCLSRSCSLAPGATHLLSWREHWATMWMVGFWYFLFLTFLNIGMEVQVFIQVALVAPYAVWKRLEEGGPRCCWYQVAWSSAPAAVRPAEHSGVWSHNTCLYTNSNLINDFFSSAFGSRG